MNVGFLVNQLDNRGTGHATWDYAHYNETLLQNRSRIYSRENGNHDTLTAQRYEARFGDIIYIDGPEDIADVDVLYHIKSGEDDGFRIDPAIRYAVHSVFNIQPHGDRYAAISKWLADGKVPYVPHIVDLPRISLNYRKIFDIPDSRVMLGRYGAEDSFDIPWVWDALKTVFAERTDIGIMFANTRFEDAVPRSISMGHIETAQGKAAFINTTDYMLHARNRGETFGISVGEFAKLGRRVITYGGSWENAHLDELANCAIVYNDQEELVHILRGLQKPKPCYSYTQFTPFRVMQMFKKVFLE